MAEDVNIKYGHLEVKSERMQSYVKQHEMNDAEIKRVAETRIEYLHWMNAHYADSVSLAPERFLT